MPTRRAFVERLVGVAGALALGQSSEGRIREFTEPGEAGAGLNIGRRRGEPLAAGGHSSGAARTPIEVFDVRAFGAAGDGRTDDGQAIQSAIDAAQQGAGAGIGGIVYLPRGTYAVSETLDLKGAGLSLDGAHRGRISLVGEGRAASKLIPAEGFPAGGVLISVNEGGSFDLRLKELAIADLWLDGRGVDVDLLRFLWVARSRLERVLVSNTRGHGLHVQDGWDIQFRDCFFEKCGGDGSHYGTFVESTDPDQDVNNLYFFGCRWEGWLQRPGGGHLKVDGTKMLRHANKFRFISCKFHGTPSADKLAALPHIELLRAKQMDFIASHQVWTGSTFATLRDCDTIRFIGGDYAGEDQLNDYHFDLYRSRNISFDAVMASGTRRAYMRVGADCGNVVVSPTCRFGSPDPIADDPGGRAWVARTYDSECRVETGAVTSAVREFGDGVEKPWVGNGQFYRTRNTSRTKLKDFKGGRVGQRIAIQAGDMNTTVQQSPWIFLKDGISRKLDLGATAEFVMFQEGRWDEV